MLQELMLNQTTQAVAHALKDTRLSASGYLASDYFKLYIEEMTKLDLTINEMIDHTKCIHGVG